MNRIISVVVRRASNIGFIPTYSFGGVLVQVVLVSPLAFTGSIAAEKSSRESDRAPTCLFANFGSWCSFRLSHLAASFPVSYTKTFHCSFVFLLNGRVAFGFAASFDEVRRTSRHPVLVTERNFLSAPISAQISESARQCLVLGRLFPEDG